MPLRLGGRLCLSQPGLFQFSLDMNFELAQFRFGARLCLLKFTGMVLRGQGRPFKAFILRGQSLDALAKFHENRLLLLSALLDSQSPDITECFQTIRRVGHRLRRSLDFRLQAHQGLTLIRDCSARMKGSQGLVSCLA
jgi:hypothetical protein